MLAAAALDGRCVAGSLVLEREASNPGTDISGLMGVVLPEIPTMSTTAQKKIIEPHVDNKAGAEEREQIKWEGGPRRGPIVGRNEEETDAVVPEVIRGVTEGRG